MDLTNAKDIVLLAVGNIFIAFLAVRAFGTWAKKEWGEFATLIATAVVIAGLVWFPEQVVDALKWAWSKMMEGL